MLGTYSTCVEYLETGEYLGLFRAVLEPLQVELSLFIELMKIDPNSNLFHRCQKFPATLCHYNRT